MKGRGGDLTSIKEHAKPVSLWNIREDISTRHMETNRVESTDTCYPLGIQEMGKTTMESRQMQEQTKGMLRKINLPEGGGGGRNGDRLVVPATMEAEPLDCCLKKQML